MKYRSIPAVLVAAGLLFTGAGVIAPPASAAATCVVGATTYSPAVFVLGTSYGKEMTVTTKVTNCDSQGLNDTDVTWWINDGDNVSQLATFDRASYSDRTITLTGTFYEKPSRLFNAAAGDSPTFVQIADMFSGGVYSRTTTPVLQLRRAVGVTTNATLEPVTKGKVITITGTVSRANWDTGRYAGYADHIMYLQYRTLAGSYVTLKPVYTDTNGNLRTTVHAGRDGCYRFLSKQTPTAGAAVSGGDCVDVK